MSTWASKITTSLRGRRMGLQIMTTGESGGAATRGSREFLVGPEAFRQPVSTANTTDVNVPAYGVQVLPGGVFTIDPPIPGVQVTIVGSSDTASYLKTNAATETIMTTLGSSDTVLAFAAAGGGAILTGITTSRFLAILTTGVVASTST